MKKMETLVEKAKARSEKNGEKHGLAIGGFSVDKIKNKIVTCIHDKPATKKRGAYDRIQWRIDNKRVSRTKVEQLMA